MRAFIAVAEEGGFSAAARRLHVSQSALSQTLQSLERQLGVQLLTRTSTGTRLTEAGGVLLGEARGVLARHDRAVQAVVGTGRHADRPLHVGLPLELPPDLLPAAFTRLATSAPDVRVEVRHLSTTSQITELREGRIDVALVRERPPGPEFDAMLVVSERLGVLLANSVAEEVADPQGVRLEALAGLRWVGFARDESPAWYDQIVAVLRGHGVVVDPPSADDTSLIAEVKFAAVGSGRAFALAPSGWNRVLPDGVTWSALVGAPLVRRTWALWPAASRSRDVGAFISAVDPQDL